MKYKDYPSKKELCTYIISELDKTIAYLESQTGDNIQNKLEMFKVPKAMKADLIAKKREIIDNYKLTKIGKLWK